MNRLYYLAAPIIIAAQPALAGEDVQFAEAPAWVTPADIEAALTMGEEIVLYDRQIRLEGGVVTRYTDIAYDVRTTDALQKLGTQQFSWFPDKGDLVIHRLQLIRDGKTIDLVAQGLRPEILRRERELEKRSVDGALTAAFAIPGMQVGDVLRISSSISLRDQALDNEMQVTEGLVAEPTKLGFGRLRVTWPNDTPVTWQPMGQVGPVGAVTDGGDNVVELALPIAEPEAMPEDAPRRFQVSPQLQFGTFASWEEVGAVMAPHFSTDGAIGADSPIAREVERIMAQTSVPVERAALALRLVQDEISYLANGMNGGNYLPQMPQQTWDLKFGDCKAKSMLLLAMLRQMEIESNVVLVDSDWGDAVSISQPLPGAFDHMIVHARIDGLDYWLDGTSAGARLDTIYEVPNFGWALPVVPSGAEPVKMVQRWPKVPDEVMTVKVDLTAGVDMPALYEATIESRGVMGARMRASASETDPKLILGAANQKIGDLIGGVVYDASFSYDEDAGVARMTAKGLIWEGFAVERDIATYAVDGATTNWEFKPDRARSAWRELPFMVGGPYTYGRELTVLLPDRGDGAKLQGIANLDEIAAGTKFYRTTSLEGGILRLSDRTSYVPAELDKAAIAEGKSAMRRIASGDPQVKIEAPTRFWEIEDKEIARRVAPMIAGIDRLAAEFDDKAQMVLLRGLVHMMGRNYALAQADFERAVELEASAEAYQSLAQVQALRGDMAGALASAERAFDLQGDVATASEYAGLLARADRADEGLDLLDGLGLTGDEAVSVMTQWSELSGYAKRESEAWERLAEMIDERPEDVSLLNSKCWMAGVWNYNLDDALAYCEEAVTLSGQDAGVIDSRALVKFRQGRIDEALADVESALAKEPGLASSRYLRGLIRIGRGDAKGREDIVQAERIDPSIAARFEDFGLKP
jgi:tetratricopeptide (TPR) repeat protein